MFNFLSIVSLLAVISTGSTYYIVSIIWLPIFVEFLNYIFTCSLHSSMLKFHTASVILLWHDIQYYLVFRQVLFLLFYFLGKQILDFLQFSRFFRNCIYHLKLAFTLVVYVICHWTYFMFAIITAFYNINGLVGRLNFSL